MIKLAGISKVAGIHDAALRDPVNGMLHGSGSLKRITPESVLKVEKVLARFGYVLPDKASR